MLQLFQKLPYKHLPCVEKKNVHSIQFYKEKNVSSFMYINE